MSARNVVAGLALTVWSAVVGLAVVPFYLRFLGLEAYGLVGLLATTQALLQMLDMGLAATVSREVSKRSACGDKQRAANLAQSLARIYWLVSLAIATLMIALAPVIANRWVRAQGLSNETVHSAIQLIGIVIAARWPIGLYQGILIGKQQLVTTSAIGIVAVTVANLGSVLLLAYVAPSVTVLFAFQACIGFCQALTLRHAAWRALGRASTNAFRFSELKAIWRFSTGMGLIAILGVILTQTDKLLLSRLLELSEYGKYTLAAVVAGSLYICVIPTFNTLYPRFVELVERKETSRLAETYHLATSFLAAVLFPLAGFFAVFSTELVGLWTGNLALATAVAPIIALLAAGSALHGLMHIPHAMVLAYGATRIPIVINLVLVAVQIPALVLLTTYYGVTGAACAWILLHSLYCLLGTWLTHRTFLQGQGWIWLIKDVGIPALISAIVAVVASILVKPVLNAPAVTTLCAGIGLLVLSVAASILVRRDTRRETAIRWRRLLASTVTSVVAR